jgi:hypothetical protein
MTEAKYLLQRITTQNKAQRRRYGFFFVFVLIIHFLQEPQTKVEKVETLCFLFRGDMQIEIDSPQEMTKGIQ